MALQLTCEYKNAKYQKLDSISMVHISDVCAAINIFSVISDECNRQKKCTEKRPRAAA